MPKIIVKINLEKDAWNWWDGCNKVSHGVDWKLRIPEHLRVKIIGKSQKEAFDFLIPFLTNWYQENDVAIKAYLKDLKKIFNKKGNKIFQIMEKVTGQPVYLDKFYCFITSFPRSPYNFEKGYIWLQIFHKSEIGGNPENQITIFIHELLHFQVHYYYEKELKKQLTNKQFEYLKEAMTVIINDEFKEIITVEDKGYEIHKELRIKLLAIWRQEKSFDKFIDEGIKIVKEII